MDDSVLHATLGGLAHDLGKVLTPDPEGSVSSGHLDCDQDRSRPMAECPECGRYRFTHATHGSALLREVLPSFPFLGDLALHHHTETADTGTGEAIGHVKNGDLLSASEHDERYDRHEGKAQALISPFPVASEVEVSIGPLTSGALFHTAPASSELTSGYADLSRALREALSAAEAYSGGNIRSLPDHLLGAVETSASLVPSAPDPSMADVSLASHAHLAGAFAGALSAGGMPTDGPLADTQEVAALIAGDLSGIQPFIHRVASARAARSLRARSFYVSLLSLVAARFVAVRTGVSPANVLGIAGGNFTVIAPITAVPDVQKIRDELDSALFAQHGTAIGVSLAARPLMPRDVSSFSVCERDLRRDLSDAKSRRYQGAAVGNVFQPRGSGGSSRACRNCGEDAAGGRVEDDGDERVCPFCVSLESLGHSLPRQRYLTVREDPEGRATEDWQSVFQQLGFAVELHESAPSPPLDGALFALSADLLEDTPCARLLPTARYVPWNEPENRVADFRDLGQRASGRPLLGVLKADVDDLGMRLSEHAAGSRDSPSRSVTFSRFLSLFFEGHVNDLVRNEYSDIYMVFAGGDDLMAIGPWDSLLEFAARVRDDLARWTSEGDRYHMSAGIAFGDPHWPVRNAEEEAERLLTRAKQRTGKNSVAVFDRAMPWPLFEETLELKQTLTTAIESGDGDRALARGLLQRLTDLYDHAPADPDERASYGPHVYRVYYVLARMAERRPEHENILRGIYREILKPGGALKVAIAARLAEFATAPESDSQGDM